MSATFSLSLSATFSTAFDDIEQPCRSKGYLLPHPYYLERRDPNFDAKMAQVLFVYREVALLRGAPDDASSFMAILSFDEKPGIQAIGNTAPDLPPVVGKHPSKSTRRSLAITNTSDTAP